MLITAKRIEALKPSATLAVSAKADELIAKGEDIINLCLGEPDFPTPKFICDAAIKAIHDGKTRYTAVDGTTELKKAIIDKLARDHQLTYQPNQILASCGAKHSLFNLFMAILNPGDEVLIPAPFWVSYPDIALLAEAKPVIMPTTEKQHYKITAQQLEKAITPKTRILALNSPCNPTGAVYTRAELVELSKVLLKHPNIIITSDDIYEKILWGSEPFCNIVMACPELNDRTVVINGASKAYAMTGWRLGYAAGPASIIAGAKKIQSQSTSNPCSISQAAMTAALNGNQECVTKMTAAFKQRYEFFHTAINKMPGLSAPDCQGAFYLFINVEGAMKQLGLKDDIAFAEFLLHKAKVACVPGSAFGTPGCVRFSYAVDISILEETVNRIKEAL